MIMGFAVDASQLKPDSRFILRKRDKAYGESSRVLTYGDQWSKMEVGYIIDCRKRNQPERLRWFASLNWNGSAGERFTSMAAARSWIEEEFLRFMRSHIQPSDASVVALVPNEGCAQA